jgi:glyoxylase I family protein
MQAKTSGVHHVTIRVADLERTRSFYEKVLGFAIQAPAEDFFFFTAGSTLMVFREPLEGTPEDDRFSEYRIGVDHLAFAVDDRKELERVVEVLRGAGVQTEGIEVDPVLNKEYVCFRDPDNVQLEFYMN